MTNIVNTGTTDAWVRLAEQRPTVTLRDGRRATLIGVPRHKGVRARIEFGNGNRATIHLHDIVAVNP